MRGKIQRAARVAGMYRRNCHRKFKGGWAIAFGAGLLVASVCSTKLLIILLAVAVVILGCCCK